MRQNPPDPLRDLTEPSSFPMLAVRDSESVLVREASMDDESLFE